MFEKAPSPARASARRRRGRARALRLVCLRVCLRERAIAPMPLRQPPRAAPIKRNGRVVQSCGVTGTPAPINDQFKYRRSPVL
jgi:hypothetical protein